MLEIVVVLASAVAGLFEAVSKNGSKGWIRQLASTLSGIALALSVTLQPVAEVFAGMILGAVAAGVRGTGDRLKISAFFLVYSIYPKVVQIAPVVVAALLSYADEKKYLGKPAGKRLLLPVATAAAVPIIGWVPAAAVIAYRTGEWVAKITYKGTLGA